MDKINYERELNPGQLEAVNTLDGPLLVLAGAGSGKTRTLIYRVCRLIENGVDPDEILLLTFTNKAAKEMQERAAAMLGDERAQEVTACTYHSFCTSMLRQYAFKAGLSDNFTVYSTSDERILAEMMAADEPFTAKEGFPDARTVVSIISATINRGCSMRAAVAIVKPELFDVDDGGFVKELSLLKEKTAAYKREHDVLGYDDLMLRFRELLVSHPETAGEIDRRFKYVLVDEYQDTNPLQAEIVKLIRQVNDNLMAVGDDRQSIYGFRGSDVKIIRRFADDYAGARIVYLKTNYRSTPEIVRFADEVMEKNDPNDPYKRTHDSPNEKGPKPVFVSVDDQNAEAEVIVGNIAKEIKNGRSPEKICVLMRSTFASAALETALNREGIPFEKRGGEKFFDKKIIKDAMAYLRLFTNPKDTLSWFRVLQKVKGIGDATAKAIAERCGETGFEALEAPEYDGKAWKSGLDELTGFIKSFDACVSFTALTDKIADALLEERKKEIGKTVKTAEQDLDQLRVLARNFDTAAEFLDAIILETALPEMLVSEDDPPRVVLSTVHSAKGLEFDSVYIMDCVNAMFPCYSAEPVGSAEDLEELRCFYVAVTRARRNLIMMNPGYRSTRWGDSRTSPSRYISGCREYKSVDLRKGEKADRKPYGRRAKAG